MPDNKRYSVIFSSGGKKVIIPLVDTGQRIEIKGKTGKFRKMIIRVLKGIKPSE